MDNGDPPKSIKELFFRSINSSSSKYITSETLKIFETYPKPLSIARYDEENLTILHLLARMPSQEFGRDHQTLLVKIWAHVREMEPNKIVELISEPSVALFDAVESGNSVFVQCLLISNRELLTITDAETGQNLLHSAVSYRERDIFRFLINDPICMTPRAVDKNRNNVLHFAAANQLKPSSGLRPNIQLKREVVWYKEVEKSVPWELKKMRNKEGKTPSDVFNENHKELAKEVKIATAGMVVAALIATIAFTAALTAPGDKNNGWFIVFILTNAIALFSSSSSIIAFLSIFTSMRFKEGDFLISLHPSLIMGLSLLFVAIATMVVTFAATCFLIFEHKNKWAAYVATSSNYVNSHASIKHFG